MWGEDQFCSLTPDVVQILFGFFNWSRTLKSAGLWVPFTGNNGPAPTQRNNPLTSPQLSRSEDTKEAWSPGSTRTGAADPAREGKRYRPLCASFFKEQMIDCAALWKHLIKYLTG